MCHRLKLKAGLALGKILRNGQLPVYAKPYFVKAKLHANNSVGYIAAGVLHLFCIKQIARNILVANAHVGRYARMFNIKLVVAN